MDSQTNILLVDDDKNVHKTIKDHLKTFKHAFKKAINIQTASSVQEAKKMLQNNKYDLVITDYMLDGGKTADSVIECIKKNNKNCDYNVITSVRDIGKIREILETGASEVIYKPFTCEDIISSVFKSLNKKKEQ